MEPTIEQAAKLLEQGRLVIFPTDTVFGIGASLMSPDAIFDLYRAKNREPEKPTAVLVHDLEQIKILVDWISYGQLVEKFIHFWPGALTLILPISDSSEYLPGLELIGGPEHKVGIRIPDHDQTLALIRGLGHPIVASSANLSGQASPCTFDQISLEMREAADLTVRGVTKSGLSSTVVDLTFRPPRILREGDITAAQIKEACST